MDIKQLFICSCSSLEHQMMFWREDEKNGFLYAEVHLTNRDNFFERLWYGLKYVFGCKSRFGAWDEFLFTIEDEKKLKDYLNSI